MHHAASPSIPIYCFKPSPSYSKLFDLPLEIREHIYGYSLPGPRLIEVYARPVRPKDDDDVDISHLKYRWKAVRCECKRRCYALPAVTQINREARAYCRKRAQYARCFDTYVNWKLDTIYIGDRVNHLHNLQFLHAVERGGGISKPCNLALNRDLLSATNRIHVNRDAFKRCSSLGMLERLSGLRNLIIVGPEALGHGEKNENEVEAELEWSDIRRLLGEKLFPGFFKIEFSAYEHWETKKRAQRKAGNALDIQCSNSYPKEDQEEGNSSQDWSLSSSPYFCHGPVLNDPFPYKPFATDDSEYQCARNGNCGLALTDFDAVTERNVLMYGHYSIDKFMVTELFRMMAIFIKEQIEDLCEDKTVQYFEDANEDDYDPEKYMYQPDYDSFKHRLPKISLALPGKPAPSCFQADWGDLGKNLLP